MQWIVEVIQISHRGKTMVLILFLMCCHPTVPGVQDLKGKVATDIRMHTAVLISAHTDHTGSACSIYSQWSASKSNQGGGREQKLIMRLFSLSFHPICFSLSRQKLKGWEFIRNCVYVCVCFFLIEDQHFPSLYFPYTLPLILCSCCFMHLLKMRGRLHFLTAYDEEGGNTGEKKMKQWVLTCL